MGLGRLVILTTLSVLLGPVEADAADRPAANSEHVPEVFLPPDLKAIPAIIESVTSRAESVLYQAMAKLQDQAEPPYYMALQVYDTTRFKTSAVDGFAGPLEPVRTVSADIDVRVGSPELDNTHERARWGGGGTRSVALPYSGAVQATEVALWLAMDDAYRDAVERLEEVRGNVQIEVEREDQSPDFSVAPITDDLASIPVLDFDPSDWRQRLAEQSAHFVKYPHLVKASATLEVTQQVRTFYNTEGTRVRSVRRSADWRISAEVIAEDGMRLHLADSAVAEEATDLPSQDEMNRRLEELVARLLELELAPVGEPQAAPAILTGRAAAVFFHEVFGHRAEGHRQKDEDEGQTFTHKVGELILPGFISVVDDPTLAVYAGVPLNGHYTYDDEGVPASRVELVDSGTLRAFLVSRSPIRGFPQSNGHGRRSAGNSVVSRQANLLVEVEQGVSPQSLRARLLEEVDRQGAPYGYVIDDIAGGFTFTGRTAPNAFNVRPLVVWRVYLDGRPDELIRGIDLIGTPLVSFSRIIAAGDTNQVFNGFCGAESGYVPVSASSPAMLLSEIEVQRKEKSKRLPPILPPPSADDGYSP